PGDAVPGVDGVHLDGAADRVVPPGAQRLRLRGVGFGVGEGAGLLDERADVGALGLVQFADVLAEVGLGGGLHAVGVAPEVDGVQVLRDDLVRGELAGHLQRDEDLLDLPGVAALLGEAVVVVPGHLLGDGGAATGLAAADHRAHGAGDRHPGGLVEVVLLGAEHPVDHGVGDLLPGDLGPVDRAGGGGLGPVGGVDLGGGGGRVGLRLGGGGGGG